MGIARPEGINPRFVHCVAALMLGGALLLAVAAPLGFWLALGAVAASGAGLLAFDFPIAATVGWLVLTGSTPEYWLGDLGGGASVLVAAEKFAALAIALLCIGRYGFTLDACNPVFGFAAIFAIGFQQGLHPRLDGMESVRSLAGSVAPFVFSFSRVPVCWARAVIRWVCWLPALLIVAGAGLAATGTHPMVVDQSGLRLQATGIPAFLGGFAEAAVYACLLETMRGGRRTDMLLLGVNIAVLVLSGARAPLAVTMAIAVLALAFVPSPALRALHRLPFALAGAAVLPVLVVAASQLSDIRLFNVLSGEAGSMSGRDMLWPLFREAWDERPLLGYGLGAAKVVISPDSAVAHLTGTTAPHNEYLRIGVEGGALGLSLLLILFAAWTTVHTRRMARLDRQVLRLVMLGIAVHAATDNLLISTTAGILFAWVSAAFARGEQEWASDKRV